MRINFGCVWLAILAGLFCCANAEAVVVELSSGRRVVGWLISEDTQVVRISSTAPEDNAEVSRLSENELSRGGAIRRINRSEIIRLIQTVDQDRLERLSPNHPNGYRDYAEELSAMRQDPEARTTAERLFVIAAHLAPNQLGGAAMLGLRDLAIGHDERKVAGYHAMAYMMNPQLSLVLEDESMSGRASALTGKRSNNKIPDAGGEARSVAVTWQRFKEALRYFRRGDMKQASQIARVDSVRNMFTRVPGLISYDEFERICLKSDLAASSSTGGNTDGNVGGGGGGGGAGGGGVDISLDQLRLMLLVELSSSPPPATPKTPTSVIPTTASDSDTRGIRDWASVMTHGGGAPLAVMNLRALSGFNPTLNVYRNGRWQQPSP